MIRKISLIADFRKPQRTANVIQFESSVGVKSELARAELQGLCSEAKTLHAEALKIKESIMHGAMSALEEAWQCGKRISALPGSA
jgi:hypothetical protein